MVLSDTSINLERSSFYKHRQKLLSAQETPTISDATKNLGNDLAKVVFQQCIESVKPQFGIEPPLKGPLGDLWISPSDLLIGKVALKPPFTSKCLQALTHKGIIEIGEIVEKKFLNEMEIEKKKALEKSRRQLMNSLEDKMNAEIKDVEIRERLRCSVEIDKLTKEFDQILLAELESLENRLKEEHELTLQDQEAALKIQFQEEMDREVQKTVHTLTTEFFEKLDEQEKILTLKFKEELKKLQIHHKHDNKINERLTKRILRQVKHYLECKNLANMMYVLCVERRKCCEQKRHIEEHYKNEIYALQKTLSGKDEDIEKLKGEKAKTLKDLQLRETCLLKILAQFQKFINFALRASPTQAEFLLSVEKMMVFEMSDVLMKTDLPTVQSEADILPWLHGNDSISSTQSSGMDIKDFHNCMYQVTPPGEGDSESEGELPAVYYKGKMYVREDFRDMIAAGIKITPSNELWNEDVEILMQTMRASVTTFTRSEDAEPTDSGFAIGVKWSRKKVSMGENSNTTATSKLARKRSSLRPSSGPLPLQVEMLPPMTATQSTLLAVRDSLELVKQKENKRSSGQKEDTNSENVEILKTVYPMEYPGVGPYQSPDTTYDEQATFLEEVQNVLEVENGELSFIKEQEQVSFQETDQSLEKYAAVYFGKSMPTSAERSEIENLKSEASKPPKDDHFREIYESATQIKKREPQNLAVETKDSIIMTRISMIKKSEEFHISPQDSIENRKEQLSRKGQSPIVSKPSKLMSARNSLEMLRESVSKLREPMPECPKRKLNNMSDFSINKVQLSCCEKGSLGKELLCKNINSSRRGSASFSDKRSLLTNNSSNIYMSETKATAMDKFISSVGFEKQAIVYDEQEALKYDTEVQHPTSLKSSQEAIALKPNKLKVVGETNAREGDQTSQEFTVDRIHSLIDLIKDHPNLIRLFTSK